jgi:hypothetical protein
MFTIPFQNFRFDCTFAKKLNKLCIYNFKMIHPLCVIKPVFIIQYIFVYTAPQYKYLGGLILFDRTS